MDEVLYTGPPLWSDCSPLLKYTAVYSDSSGFRSIAIHISTSRPRSLNAIPRASSGNAIPNIKPPYDRQMSLGYSNFLNPYFVIQRAWTQLNKVLLLNTYKILEVLGQAYADLHLIVALWEAMADFPKIEGVDDIPERIVQARRDYGSFADLPQRKRTKGE
ncbi:hypothetical protein EW146_g8378 [Bondarzewia mesenterica]|uniref:Uncharacterized protein n=1 Tax=Bondarzewia mesenterica TaxID=1095465 RepID=A0A4S4LEX7_9AGAM|nr:hypothetical protein EW146_g8378 [Bondarzewia mesenterica]